MHTCGYRISCCRGALMSTTKIYSDHSIDLSVPLGRLIYQGGAAKGLELAYDERAGTWLQRRPGEAGPGRVTTLLQAMHASTVLRRWVMPVAVSLVVGTLGATGVWYALHDRTAVTTPPKAVLPPPLPESPGLLESVAVPYSLPVAPPETAASAVLEPPIGLEPEPAPSSAGVKPPLPKPGFQAEAPAKPTAPVPAKAIAPEPKAETRQPKPAEAKPSAQGTSKVAQSSEREEADQPVFDAGSTAARTASPVERSKSVASAEAAPAPSAAVSSKAILAVPTRDWIVATDPSSNLPRRYKVGETLPSGARIISADPSTGVVTTDRGNLRLE